MKNYRKIFDILIVVALLVIGVGMIKLGDRLIAFQKGEMTSQLEIEQLRQDLNRAGNITDAVSGWLPNGGETPSFSRIQSRSANISVPPTMASSFGGATVQAIAQASRTTINFSGLSNSYDSDSLIIPMSGSATKFILNPIYSKTSVGSFLACGFVSVANGVDAAFATLTVYRTSDDYLYPDNKYTVIAANGQGLVTSFTFCFTVQFSELQSVIGADPKDDVYFTLDVYQDELATVNTNLVTLAFTKLR